MLCCAVHGCVVDVYILLPVGVAAVVYWAIVTDVLVLNETSSFLFPFYKT